MSNDKTITATVEYGIFGYVLGVADFRGETVDELAKQINSLTADWARDLELADDRDGDLRAYTRPNANGYPTFCGLGAEFGDEFDGTILMLKLGDEELDFNSVGHTKLRRAAGLS